MARETFQVSITDPSIRKIVSATFPTYRGRKIRVETSDRPVHVESYWSGGSRNYFQAYDMRDGRTMPVPQNGTPFDGGPIRPDGVEVPAGFAIVEHSIFCGKDAGIRIHVHPDSLPRLLPQGR